jgi:hypothetical protein
MKLREVYEVAVNAGMDADPRGRVGAERMLDQARQDYEALAEKNRWEFDLAALTNPYADTRILYGDPETEVTSMLVGIDMEVGEVLLADSLRNKGRDINLLLAHHPEGRAVARLEEVMGVQADVWNRFGVSLAYGDAVMRERQNEITRRLHPLNTERALAAARLLDFPFMCCHTPADNNVNSYLQQRCNELGGEGTVDALLDMLKGIPEYREATLQGVGPIIFEGNGKRRTGRIMVDMTGGTSGPMESLEKLANAGVGTIVGMHMSEDHRKKAKEHHLNVVIAGHLSSDSLGMNFIVDEYERRGVTIVPCSGFIRVSRV